ncbi:hypothetical protein [Streptomyces sp. NPDC050504]|uniref:hypothetical protein n=1 Tax=Streptomyces sp. NPDC050504 TaxID=3365618 RepID=UPI00379E1150
MSVSGGRANAAPRWRIGEVVDGRYEVLRIHEHGGMGLVYRVRHLQWGTDLAVKSPRPELLSSPGFLDRFVAEAETWVSLGLHPHVCGCHYVRAIDGVPRVVAEYVTGYTPRDFPRAKDPWQVVLQSAPVPIRRRDPGMPRALASVIDRALTEQPAIGFQSAADLRRELLPYAG